MTLLEGLLVVNKPIGYTSMAMIRMVRKLTDIKKVGHAGTLDPLASGVLLVCIGKKATKKINYFMSLEKEYIATINLEAFSETDDAQGALQKIEIKTIPSKKIIEETIQQFIGTYDQIPPAFSAIKVQGVRAYKQARAGKPVELKARPVTIYSINILEYSWPLLTIQVTCAKGTYIRSLARDIGKALTTGGYLTQLTRTRIGPYTLEQAHDITQLTAINRDMIIPLTHE